MQSIWDSRVYCTNGLTSRWLRDNKKSRKLNYYVIVGYFNFRIHTILKKLKGTWRKFETHLEALATSTKCSLQTSCLATNCFQAAFYTSMFNWNSPLYIFNCFHITGHAYKQPCIRLEKVENASWFSSICNDPLQDLIPFPVWQNACCFSLCPLLTFSG